MHFLWNSHCSVKAIHNQTSKTNLNELCFNEKHIPAIMLCKPLHCVKEHNLIWIAINNAPQNPSEVCRFGQSLSYEVGITIHKKMRFNCMIQHWKHTTIPVIIKFIMHHVTCWLLYRKQGIIQVTVSYLNTHMILFLFLHYLS